MSGGEDRTLRIELPPGASADELHIGELPRPVSRVPHLPELLRGRDPVVVELYGWFRYDHLPATLAAVSRPFHDLATWLLGVLPDGDQLVQCLRRLLEAKDCAVRAAAPH